MSPGNPSEQPGTCIRYDEVELHHHRCDHHRDRRLVGLFQPARRRTIVAGDNVGVSDGSVEIDIQDIASGLSERAKFALASAERDDVQYLTESREIIDDSSGSQFRWELKCLSTPTPSGSFACFHYYASSLLVLGLGCYDEQQYPC